VTQGFFVDNKLDEERITASGFISRVLNKQKFGSQTREKYFFLGKEFLICKIIEFDLNCQSN